jgi:peptidoglycan-associated lipoprotein
MRRKPRGRREKFPHINGDFATQQGEKAGGTAMNRRIFPQILALAIIVSMFGSGCAWWKRTFGPKQPTTAETAVPPLDGPGAMPGVRPYVTGWPSKGVVDAVLFDFDSATIKPSEMHKVQAAADYLRRNPGVMVLEGHTDERGTAEYNRALGERRAQAVRQALIRLGVDPNRLQTISYGKDRPVDPAHDEEAWRKNRRVEFVMPQQ